MRGALAEGGLFGMVGGQRQEAIGQGRDRAEQDLNAKTDGFPVGGAPADVPAGSTSPSGSSSSGGSPTPSGSSS